MWLSTGLVYSLVLYSCTTALPHSTPNGSSALSLQMAQSIMSREQGILTSQGDSSALLQAGFTQKALHALGAYYAQDSSKPAIDIYVTRSIDSVVPVVSNATKDTSYPLDRLSNGNGLLRAWREMKLEKYHAGVSALRESVDLQPKNAEGGLWYYVYPYWSYLDGMYSFAPFMAAYVQAVENNSYCLEDIVLQLDLLWQHCYHNETGLLVHGYDARRQAVWANNMTGASPHVWGRSLGWYCMALIDMLELLPASARETRAYVEAKFQQLMAGVVRAVDTKTGAWWQILDQPAREGNYIESSSSSMFVYSLLKGVRLGVLSRDEDASALTRVARRGYEYVADTFVVHNANGTLGWNGTVAVCSLNSTASYEYYVGRPILYNSVLGSAAFVLASLEYERLQGK